MANKRVIDLGAVREMLAHLDVLRDRIVSGCTSGLHTTIMDSEKGECVISAGVYRNDPHRAISAILNASAKRMLAEDQPLPRSGTF